MAKIVIPGNDDQLPIVDHDITNDDDTVTLEGDTVTLDDVEYTLDKDGNAVDKEGAIFKTADELKDATSSTKTDDDDADDTQSIENNVDIDGVIYTINEDGAAVDENGAVKYTKDELAEMAEVEESTPEITVDDLAKETNIVITDDKGNPIEFGNTKEDVVEYVNQVYNQAARTEVAKEFDKFFSSYPIMRDVFLHVQANNGSLDGFNKTVDYSSINIEKDNEAQLKSIIYTARQMRGDTPEMIDDYYKYLSSASDNLDKVAAEAERELSFLVNTDKQRREAYEARIQQDNVQNAKIEREYWGVDVQDNKLVDLNVEGSVFNVINKGELKVGDDVYTIPEKIKVVTDNKIEYKTRNDFFDYLFVPRTYIINGERVSMTEDEYNIAVENSTKNVNDDIFGALKRFTNYDTSQFIKDQIAKEKTKAIKKLTVRANKGTKGAKPNVHSGKRLVVPNN